MSSPNPGVPRGLISMHVLVRFFLRTVMLVFFGLASRHGFGPTFEGLLGFATLYCLLAATLRREALFGETLTHFDEAAAYAFLAGLTRLAA